MRFAAVPDELRKLPQWVIWRQEVRNDKPTKVPYQPAQPAAPARADDPATWSSFEMAVTAAQQADGIGFEFHAEDPYCGIDIDKCRDPETGDLSPEAEEWIDRFATYTEVSPTGTGVHMIGKGRIPGLRKRTGPWEMYDQGRYFTMTGHRIGARPIGDVQPALESLYTYLWPEPTNGASAAPTPITIRSDRDLLELMFRSKNGDDIHDLYDGRWDARYTSQSEADYALCLHLAWWTNQDASQMDSLFRTSGLMRDKWGDRRPGGSYGAETIANAIDQCQGGYEPPAGRKLTLAPPPAEQPDEPLLDAAPLLRVITLAEFAAITEDVAEPIIGTPTESLLPANGLLLMYGDGGAGKTTLSIDAMAHLASGTDWIGIPVPRPIRVLLIENEGPRGPFRERINAKIEAWTGTPFHPQVVVLEEPWTRFTLTEAEYRQELARQIDHHQVDLIIVGPLASIGAKGSGTPDEVSEFDDIVKDLRERTQRTFALWIVHHENKQGDVSGAWERYPDTLVHVQAQGNGRTRIHWRKVRWSSELHDTSSQLTWLEGAGFQIEEQKVRDLPAELTKAFAPDNQWRTAKEAADLINANVDKVRETLGQLVETHEMEYEQGPLGRRGNAKCWRLKTDSDPLSQYESVRLLEAPADETDSPTPPYRESGSESVTSGGEETDSTQPSQLGEVDTPDNDDDIPF